MVGRRIEKSKGENSKINVEKVVEKRLNLPSARAVLLRKPVLCELGEMGIKLMTHQSHWGHYLAPFSLHAFLESGHRHGVT